MVAQSHFPDSHVVRNRRRLVCAPGQRNRHAAGDTRPDEKEEEVNIKDSKKHEEIIGIIPLMHLAAFSL